MVLMGTIVLGIGIFYQQQLHERGSRGGALRGDPQPLPLNARPFPARILLHRHRPTTGAIRLSSDGQR